MVIKVVLWIDQEEDSCVTYNHDMDITYTVPAMHKYTYTSTYNIIS